MTETKDTKDGIKVYEIGFHLAPIVGEDNIAHEVSLIRDALDKIKAEVVSEDLPRLCPLAYPISKVIKGAKRTFKEAYFGWIKFEADGEDMASLKEVVEKLENILRFLIIKTVRDNTLYGPKFATKEQIKGAMKKDEEEVIDAGLPEKEKPALSAEELDKTIDDLVV